MDKMIKTLIATLCIFLGAQLPMFAQGATPVQPNVLESPGKIYSTMINGVYDELQKTTMERIVVSMDILDPQCPYSLVVQIIKK